MAATPLKEAEKGAFLRLYGGGGEGCKKRRKKPGDAERLHCATFKGEEGRCWLSRLLRDVCNYLAASRDVYFSFFSATRLPHPLYPPSLSLSLSPPSLALPCTKLPVGFELWSLSLLPSLSFSLSYLAWLPPQSRTLICWVGYQTLTVPKVHVFLRDDCTTTVLPRRFWHD